MKVRAGKKSFWFKDSVRERMTLVKKGEIFDHPTKEDRDRQELFSLLQGHVVIVDEAYIPIEGKYIGIQNHQEEKSDGTRLKIIPNQPISLNQEQASRLMALSIVRPEKNEAWRPSFLLTGSVSPEPPKRMFDYDEPPRNWVMEPHRVKGGAE